MGELWRVSRNEWMKLLHRKRLWVAAILALLLVVLFAYGTHRDQQDRQRYQTPAYTSRQITNTKDTIKEMKAEPQTAQMKERIKQQESQLQQLEQQYKLQKAEQSGNWKPPVESRVKHLQAQITALSSGSSVSQQNKVQIQQDKYELMPLQYELSHNAKPILPWQSSPYESFTSFMSIASSVFLPLIVVIVTADMVSGEATSGTIKLLLVRPVSRTKILLGKWLISMFATIILTLLTTLALLIAAMAALGNQGALMPQVVGVYYNFIHMHGVLGPGTVQGVPILAHASVLPMWKFTLSSILLVTFSMLSVASVTFLCSTLFKSSMASTAVALGVVILGNIAVEMMNTRWMVLWFPTHFNLAADWVGQLARQLKMNVGLTEGALILCAWIIGSLLISVAKFKRQEILNA